MDEINETRGIICGLDADSEVRSYQGKARWTKTMVKQRADALKRLHALEDHDREECEQCSSGEFDLIPKYMIGKR